MHPPKELHDLDLALIIAGKDTISRANRTLDTINTAASDISSTSRQANSLIQKVDKLLGS